MQAIHRALFLGAALLAGTAVADDITGAKHILCSVQEVNLCISSGECVEVLPENLAIPHFVEIDVKAKKLATTAASGENRETIALNVIRENGLLVMHGIEEGRAFSLLIRETTGWASFASAAEERGVVVFGICTPDD